MSQPRLGAGPLALLGLALLACADAPHGPEPRPDVLLVVLDTVRADRTQPYGHTRETTPQLAALAEAGVVFEDVTAPAPWTWPSHASLFTGEPPWVHGAHPVPPGEGMVAGAERGMPVGSLRADLPTLAERFRAAGYRTRALVVNDWLDPELGLLRGFEGASLFESDARLIEALPALLSEPDPRPLFLFVNLMTAHSPFRDGPGPWALADRRFLDPQAAPDWVRPYLTLDLPRGVQLAHVAAGTRSSGVVRYAAGELAIPADDLTKLLQLYDAGVRGVDFALSRVLEPWIDGRPESVVAVTSDHGESFGEHGALDHRVSLYPEVLRVPLVVAAPGRLPAGARVAEPVAMHALHPTLLELAGLEAPPGSLVASARTTPGAKPPPAPVAAAAWPDPVWARHAGGRYGRHWRLYREGRFAVLIPDADAARAELYDLGADPDMHRDLAASDPARRDALAAAAARHFAAAGVAPPPTPLVIPETVSVQLRRLGYAH